MKKLILFENLENNLKKFGQFKFFYYLCIVKLKNHLLTNKILYRYD